jgi:RNA polymerase sigma-B factor
LSAQTEPSPKHKDLDTLVIIYKQSHDPALLHEIVESSKGLIYYFIRLYGGDWNSQDLYQEGVEGLLKAVKRFDPRVGVKFSTYAGHCIMGELRHYIRSESSYYKPGVIKDLQYKVEQYVDNNLKETGEVPEISEIAKALNLKEGAVTEVMKGGMVSFDALDLTKIANQNLESFKLPIEDKLTLIHAINKLNDLQKKVIYMLFFRDMTQEEAATKLGINQRKVSRLKEKSLKELRKELDQ